MSKKARSGDTITGAINAMVEAAKPVPQLPAHVRLRDRDLPFWDAIVRARAPSEWTQPELVVAAQLARCQADIEQEQQELDGEGAVIKNDRGTPVANPRFAILEQLSRREMALFRTLTLNATSKADPRQIGAARKTYQAAADVKRDLESEDLLAS